MEDLFENKTKPNKLLPRTCKKRKITEIEKETQITILQKTRKHPRVDETTLSITQRQKNENTNHGETGDY